LWQRFKIQALQHLKQNLVLYLIVLFSFTVGIASGAYTVGSMADSQKNSLVQFLDGFFAVIKKSSLDTGTIFRQSLINNFQTVILTTILGLTILGIPFILIIMGIRGFFIGFSVGFLVGELGIRGFLLVLFSILPQNLIIIPCIIVTGVITTRNAIECFKRNKIPHTLEEKIRDLIPYITTVSILFLTTIAGSIIESIFVPLFLQLISGVLFP